MSLPLVLSCTLGRGVFRSRGSSCSCGRDSHRGKGRPADLDLGRDGAGVEGPVDAPEGRGGRAGREQGAFGGDEEGGAWTSPTGFRLGLGLRGGCHSLLSLLSATVGRVRGERVWESSFRFPH